MGKDVEFYEKVPDGSRLELSFEPPAGPFTSSVLFITSGDSQDQAWGDTEVRPGPKSQTLQKGHAYMVEMRVAFFNQATSTISARIRKPDGSAFSSPKTWSITGKKNDIQLRVLLIRMAA
jgi:hypothetical protein